MEYLLSPEAERVLTLLGMAADPYLLGDRDSLEPLSIIDRAVGVGHNHFPTATRDVAQELLAAGLLSDVVSAARGRKVVYRLTDKGRRLLPVRLTSKNSGNGSQHQPSR